MDLDLAGRLALVTGASRGIGYAIASGLAAEGARVAIVARGARGLDEAAARIEAATGRRPLTIASDLSSGEGVDDALARAIEGLGGLEVLVNNTGGPPEGTFRSTDDTAWQAGFEGIFMSAVRASRLAVEPMRVAGSGRIVHVLSVSARQPIEGLLTSTALRAGLLALTKAMALELGPLGITVNAVLPGYTATERLEELTASRAARTGRDPQELKAGYAAGVPLGRIGRPEEIAAAVVFFASARASYITGTSLAVDGGYLRGMP